ncbi:MAG: UvrD-helicase domain-containing protein [Candidatus Falkowbacteria bacterium]|nr:UvrD-helicase domain-containing protein [Candidatus Falkowbacteria bacterium]
MSIENLNKAQKEAATHINGPLLVVAGAGTGKTTVLIERLSYLLENNLAKPEEVLIVTFTEKASSEMEERADRILPYGYVDLWICTFHGFCERILREHALDIGLPPDFKLINQIEAWILIKKNLTKFNLNYYKPLGNPTKFIHELLKYFSRLKDENISREKYLDYADSLKLNTKKDIGSNDKDTDSDADRINELANAYDVYNQLLLDKGYLDFGDLITYAIKLFETRPSLLNYYRSKFKFVMVDEFQDTNWSQYELIKMLVEPNKNLMVVGDDDQAIYKFRGASLLNIMQFKDDYPEAKEVILLDNYRSGQKILDSAYAFIKKNNPNRLEIKLGINKELKSAKSESGSVEYATYQDEFTEISTVVATIKNLFQKNEDVKWSDFAILVRANSTALNYIDELTRQNIPNQFMSLRGLYYKSIILDIIAYLKLLDNYHESSALYRVLNISLFKIGYEDIVAINKFARNKLWSIYETLKNIAVVREVKPESVAKINILLKLIEAHSQIAKEDKPSMVFASFAYDSGLIESLDIDRDKEQFSYLNQFYQKIKKLEANEPDLKLFDFMETLDLEMEAGDTGGLKQDFEDAETVKIMTVHGSKGLEFKYVFIPNLVDKKFPTIQKSEKISIPDALVREKLPAGNIHIEEERRLFYVAITRAKDVLYLTNARDYGGARDKKPSKFIEEAGVINSSVLQRQGLEVKDNQFDINKLELMRDIESYKNPKGKVETIKYEIPSRFSFSQIAAFENCPLQYKYNFILHIPIAEKPNFQFGRLMHDTLKNFLAPLMINTISQGNLFGTDTIPPKLELKNLLKFYNERWVNSGYASVEDREAYKQKGIDILKGFFNNLEINGQPKVVALEKSFMLKVKDISLRGAIDRVDELSDGTLEIIDYKTGNPKEVLLADDKRQLLIYKIALEEMYGKTVSKLTFYYLENNTSISFAAKPKEEEKIKEKIIDTVEEIKQCNFAPNPGFLCAYCDFNRICEFKMK